MVQSSEKRQIRYEALSTSLDIYVDSVMSAYVVTIESAKLGQHAEHARLSENPDYCAEELNEDRQLLNDQLKGAVARNIFGSALVVVYGAFESTVMDFAAELTSKFGCPPLRSSHGFIKAATKHFDTHLGFPLFQSMNERQAFELLCGLRNAFVHHRSIVSEMSQDTQRAIASRSSALVHGHVAEEVDVWVPSIRCIKAHVSNTKNWARGLFDRRFEKFNIDLI